MNSGQERALAAAEAAMRKKADDVLILDLEGIFSAADYFVICSGSSTTQLVAIVREIEKELKMSGDKGYRREGTPESGWILLDDGDVVVHIFSEEARQFYDIEHLWGDGKAISV